MAINQSYEYAQLAHSPLATAFIAYGVSVSITLTVVGNIMICLAVLLVRKLRQPPNYLLVSLALTDLGVGAIVEPLSLIYEIRDQWILGPIVCKFYTSADVTLCTASILNLCAISVDRYMAITQPLTYCARRTARRFCLYVVFVWVLALIISVTPLIVLSNETSSTECQVSQNVIYQIYATLGSFYIPACTMLVLNYKIFKAARRLSLKDKRTMGTFGSFRRATSSSVKSSSISDGDSSMTASPKASKGLKQWRRLTGSFHRLSLMYGSSNHRGDNHRKLMAGETKAIKTLGVITGAFIVCWLPFFILALIKAICGASCAVPRWLDGLVLWLGYLNSALNPLLYAKYNRDFRKPFREMLCCRFKTLQSVLRHEEFNETYGSSVASTPVKRSQRPLTNGNADTIIICNGSYNPSYDTPL